MTAYSYQDWNGLSQDEQSRNPGVSITRDSPLNNPNRGVYWSGQSSATALSTHIQDTLAENGQDAERMFRLLKIEHRRAIESPRAVGNAMKRRQVDADRALDSSGFSLNDEQADQLQSATDDIYRIQDQAELLGMDPVLLANAMIDRASSGAVGFAPPRASQMRAEFREYLESPEGIESQENLNQSVRQLYAMIRHGEIDALDAVDSISDYNFSEERTQNDEREFLNSVVKSVPLERNPVAIEPSTNFSVRMDTVEEAKAMENILRWVGEHEQLPAPEKVYDAFNSWRDSGLVASPFDPRPVNRIGLVVGTGNTADETARSVIDGFEQQEGGVATQIIVLTSDENEISNASELGGRPVVQGRPKADANGLIIDGLAEAPENAVIMVTLTNEQTTDSIQRSLAANAFVGSSYSVGHIAGPKMGAHEAQAIHLAGSMRKLALGVDINGNQLNGKQLSALRTKAQDVDKEADANRYFAAGLARPRGGVTAVAFDGARNYDAAVRRYANGKDPMADGYSRVPKHAAILTTDDKQMASYKWLDENARDRTVLYAEATRKLSFAHDVSAGIDTEKVISREADTELKIFDRPRNAREGDAAQFEVDWNDPRIRGAIILVKGNATNAALNSAAQEKKIAQEAIVDYAHTGMVFDDMQSDYHAAHLTRLALEMGKRFTVVDKEGEIVSLSDAREATRKNAQSFTEISDLENAERFRGSLSGLSVPPQDISRAEHGRRNVAYALSDPIGQMTLAALPGMNPEKAAQLAKLDLTLEEVYTTKDPQVKKALYENGMPSDTVKNLGDRKVWQKAVTRALLNGNAAENLDARFVAPGQSKMLPEKSAGYVHGPDHGKPVMAFFGNSQRTFDGPGGKAVDPGELVDRKQLSEAIRAATEKGYAIGAAFEEGIGITVLEEAAKIPEARVVIATSGNPMASSPEMRMTLRTLLENEQAQVVMPTALAGHHYEGTDGIRSTRFAEMRPAMHENLAHFSDVGVVVQMSSSDQSLHIADKMNSQDKPIAVMIPNDTQLASTDAYRGSLKMARGAGRTEIESISVATVPSAQGYAEIVDVDTDRKLVDGVMRGNAGTFQSARFARSDMARGGRHHKTMGWGAAARPVVGAQSITRLAEDHQRGALAPLGQYKAPTVRELETRSIERNKVNEATSQMFADNQKRFSSQVEADARALTY